MTKTTIIFFLFLFTAQASAIDFDFYKREIVETFRLQRQSLQPASPTQEPIVLAGGFYVGNGGDVVICEEKSKTPNRYTLLDIIEGQKYIGYAPLAGSDPFKSAKKVFEKLSLLAPARFDAYLEKLEILKNHKKIIKDDEELIDLPDSSVSILPRGCRIEQLAVQLKSFDADGNKLYIAGKYWNELDHLSQTALIVHEVVTGEFFDNGHRDSYFARKLVAALFSREFNVFLENRVNNLAPAQQEVIGLLLYHLFGLKSHQFKGLKINSLKDTFDAVRGQLKVTFVDPFEINLDKVRLRFATSTPQLIDYQGFPKRLFADENNLRSKLIIELNQHSAFVFYPKLIDLKIGQNGLEFEQIILARGLVSELISPSPISRPKELIFRGNFIVQQTPENRIPFDGLKPTKLAATPIFSGVSVDPLKGIQFLLLDSDRKEYQLCPENPGRTQIKCKTFPDHITGFDW